MKNIRQICRKKSVGKIRFLPVSVWRELCFLKWLIIRILTKQHSLQASCGKPLWRNAYYKLAFCEKQTAPANTGAELILVRRLDAIGCALVRLYVVRLCNCTFVPWREKDFRFPQAGLQVRIDFLPVFHCRDDAEFDDFVTHLAEVLVRSFEGCHFFGSSFRNLE